MSLNDPLPGFRIGLPRERLFKKSIFPALQHAAVVHDNRVDHFKGYNDIRAHHAAPRFVADGAGIRLRLARRMSARFAALVLHCAS